MWGGVAERGAVAAAMAAAAAATTARGNRSDAGTAPTATLTTDPSRLSNLRATVSAACCDAERRLRLACCVSVSRAESFTLDPVSMETPSAMAKTASRATTVETPNEVRTWVCRLSLCHRTV